MSVCHSSHVLITLAVCFKTTPYGARTLHGILDGGDLDCIHLMMKVSIWSLATYVLFSCFAQR